MNPRFPITTPFRSEADAFLRKRRQHLAAFTLVELLVVIAIIAILAGLLMPVIYKSLESGKSVHCKSNLSQVGKAIIMYCSDHDGQLPASGFFGLTPYYNRDLRHFQNQIRDYLGLNESSTWSSSNFGLMEYSPTFECASYKGAKGGKGYELRSEYATESGAKIRPFGLISSAAGSLSAQPSFQDSIPAEEWAMKDDISWNTNITPNHITYRNALFFDGHVGTLDLNNQRL